ncbi:MAG: CehA/McbA family metallohydrolase [Gammaproteobacteria bacterium]|nr:CehA/McbA family metallohydrolase [Gammaproteobacteria bacterium]MDE0365675.1 CehA/McbA family metallohydrolase [Gammaproteobacteria bacterium]
MPAQAHEFSRAAAFEKMQPARPGTDPGDAARTPRTATLRVEVRDAATGQLAPANVRVFLKDSGEVFRPNDPRTATGLYRTPEWYTLDATDELELPAGQVRIEAFRGIEWSVAETELGLSPGGQHRVRLELSRIHDIAKENWVSGNTHLHLQQTDRAYANRYLRTVPLADEVRVVFVSYLERAGDDQHYISNRYRPGDLIELNGGPAALRFGWGQETRHNFGAYGEGYGHVLLLDLDELIQPVSTGVSLRGAGSHDGVPVAAAIERAHESGATVIWAHNDFGLEDIPNWVAQRVHAQNVFDGGDDTHYDASFYRYLDLGLKIPFSTGTDWFMTDLMRVYVQVGGELTIESWLRELRAGRSFITNGPLLYLNADTNADMNADNHAIGDTIEGRIGDAVRVVARAVGRADFKRLEIVYNGRVIHASATRKQGPAFHAGIDFPLEITGPGWMAVRIPWHNNTNRLGEVLRAHTSPIYIEVDGERRFDVNTARGLVQEMSESMNVLSAKGVFADEAARQAVLDVYRQGMDRLRRQVRDHVEEGR